MITIYLKQYNKIIRNADTDLFEHYRMSLLET